ncbi:MAG: hypothetical protein U0871_29455 [Gemmataceae bacterium]
MEPKTAISVTSDDPPEQQDRDNPFQAILADMTGSRPEPAEDGEDVPPPPAVHQRVQEVTPANYTTVFKEHWKPRFTADDVPDVLSDEAEATTAVDVEFDSPDLVSDLDTKVPVLVGLNGLIADLERLQKRLAREASVRTQLDRVLRSAIAKSLPAAK